MLEDTAMICVPLEAATMALINALPVVFPAPRTAMGDGNVSWVVIVQKWHALRMGDVSLQRKGAAHR